VPTDKLVRKQGRAQSTNLTLATANIGNQRLGLRGNNFRQLSKYFLTGTQVGGNDKKMIWLSLVAAN
jgi:hypothetical protein